MEDILLRDLEALADIVNNGVPIYEDNSLSTILTQLQLGQEIPESLYKAIVEIYVYFLHFDPEKGGTVPPASAEQGESQPPAEKSAEEPAPETQTEEEMS